ncbi:MAG: hypothetical protein DRP88_04830 [Candidatus Neomarinimicrobiota bacterium]|nr:MAG: hypothetical protein DRP88_04830 [Candidatus Neomarinimicrobiota bacterium]
MHERNYLFPVGVITSPKGLKGELIVSLISNHLYIYDFQDEVWLGNDPNHLHPWKVEHFEVKGKKAYLKLCDLNTVEEAEYLKGIRVFLPLKDVKELDFLRTKGYKVVDSKDEKNCFGIVSDFFLGSVQILMIVKKEDKEYLIPCVEEFIADIKKEDKKVLINYIEGLFEQ